MHFVLLSNTFYKLPKTYNYLAYTSLHINVTERVVQEVPQKEFGNPNSFVFNN